MGDRGVARGPGGPPHQRPVAGSTGSAQIPSADAQSDSLLSAGADELQRDYEFAEALLLFRGQLSAGAQKTAAVETRPLELELYSGERGEFQSGSDQGVDLVLGGQGGVPVAGLGLVPDVHEEFGDQVVEGSDSSVRSH